MNIQQFRDTVRHFVDDDSGYLRWLTGHPTAFVLNTTRTPSAAYLMLHRALDDSPTAGAEPAMRPGRAGGGAPPSSIRSPPRRHRACTGVSSDEQ
jgi:hypothetical protein